MVSVLIVVSREKTNARWCKQINKQLQYLDMAPIQDEVERRLALSAAFQQGDEKLLAYLSSILALLAVLAATLALDPDLWGSYRNYLVLFGFAVIATTGLIASGAQKKAGAQAVLSHRVVRAATVHEHRGRATDPLTWEP